MGLIDTDEIVLNQSINVWKPYFCSAERFNQRIRKVQETLDEVKNQTDCRVEYLKNPV